MTWIPEERTWRRWIAWAAFGAAAANLASIALAHAILAAGLALLALRPRSVRFPPVIWPVLALLAWTLVSAAASDAPLESLPQIKKFFVFGMLPLVYTAFRTADMCRRATESWFVVVLVAAVLAIAQFGGAAMHAAVRGGDFYASYVDDRITGFYSHWMTFSQASVLVLVTLACYLCFAKRRPESAIWLAVGGAIGAALVLSFTRSAWLALLACALYLLAVNKPRALALVPLALAIAYLAAPAALQQRVRSIQPDANQSRIVMWRTGLNMIRAHPVLGVGPERAGPLFSEFQPSDVEELPPGFYGHLHNVYIHYAAERGIPAALIVLWLFARILFDMRNGLRSLPDGRDDRRFLVHAGIAGTLAVAVLSGFDVSLGDSEVLGAFLALVGVAYRGIPQHPSSMESD